MTDVVIHAENLGKKYKIGKPQASYQTLRETIMDIATSPVRRLNLRRSQESSAGEATFWALRDINFEVRQGDSLGIIGRNGAGKTTLLKILSRITKPTTGRVILEGRVGSLLEVGTGFHPELTGRENIYLNGAILGMKQKEIRAKLDEIISFADIDKFLDTPIKHYSSGMYVRLAFAVAAHMEPDILIVDEVLAVGDAEFQKKCIGKMEDVTKQGRAVLFVSHNMAAIQQLCTRAILIDHGELVYSNSPIKVVQEYLGRGKSRAEMIWSPSEKAPGNDVIRLGAVRLLNVHGEISTEFNSSEKVSLAIDYENLKSGAKLGTTVMLYTIDGTCVFSSMSNHDEWYGRPRDIGTYRSTCKIPGNFLPGGRYGVTVLLWSNLYQDSIREDWLVEFDIHDDGSVRGDFLGRIEGIILPKLEWTTVQE